MLNYKLRKTKRGDKIYWVARFPIGNRERIDRILGNVDYTTELAATEAADALARNPKLLLEKKRGRPAANNVHELLTPKRSRPRLFEAILPEALVSIRENRLWKNGSKSERQWAQTLYDYAVPVIGKRDVRTLTVKDMLEVLRPLWRDKTETASKLRSRLEAVLSYCIVMGYRDAPNPATWRGNLALLLPAKDRIRCVKHFEAPTLDELKIVVAYCRTHPSPGSGLILFLIATVVRVTSARKLSLDQIEGDVWTIPDENMKTVQTTPFRVPLSSLAKEGLKMAKTGEVAFTMKGDLLALDTPRKRMCDILRREVTAHGIRSTFKDWCTRKDVPEILSEKALSHAYGNKVMAAYQRDDLLEKRRTLMQAWADEFNA